MALSHCNCFVGDDVTSIGEFPLELYPSPDFLEALIPGNLELEGNLLEFSKFLGVPSVTHCCSFLSIDFRFVPRVLNRDTDFYKHESLEYHY